MLTFRVPRSFVNSLPVLTPSPVKGVCAWTENMFGVAVEDDGDPDTMLATPGPFAKPELMKALAKFGGPRCR